MKILTLAALVLSLGAASPSHAQSYPAKNVRIIVGLAPAATAPELVAKIQRDAARVLSDPETRERLTKMGVDLILNTPEEFRAYLNSEIARYTKIIKSAGLKAE